MSIHDLPLSAEIEQWLGAPDDGPSLPTGFPALDAALPGGGVPMGRIAEVVGESAASRALLVGEIGRRAALAGLGVAYVRATRSAGAAAGNAAPGGAGVAALPPLTAGHGRGAERPSERREARRGGGFASGGGLWTILPADAARVPDCAEALVRSGVLALVVLDGAPVLPRQACVRLIGLARRAGTALLVVGRGGGNATAAARALRLRCGTPRPHQPPAPSGRTRIPIGIEMGGGSRHVEVECAVSAPPRPRLFVVGREPPAPPLADHPALRLALARAHSLCRARALTGVTASRMGSARKD